MAKEITLKASEYKVEGEVRPGLLSRFLLWFNEKLDNVKEKRRQKDAYKAQLKTVENAVYQKKKMERDLEEAVKKGEYRAKSFTEKFDEMSQKLSEAAEKAGGGPNNGQQGSGLKGDLFGKTTVGSGLNIDTMFSNDTTSHSKKKK
jgi:hypothetical protein